MLKMSTKGGQRNKFIITSWIGQMEYWTNITNISSSLLCIRDTSITLFDPVGRHFYKQILTYSETHRTLNLFVHYTRLVEIGLPQIWKLIKLDPS